MKSLAVLTAAVAVIGCSGPEIGREPRGRTSTDGTDAAPKEAPPPAGPQASSGPVPTGDVTFRLANFLGDAADVCIRGDDGVWRGPLFRGVAGTALTAGAVSERLPMKNANFVARVVDADCTQPRSADVNVPLVPATWNATIVMGQMANGPQARVLLDAPSTSAEYSFVRLVNAGMWNTNVDFGYVNGDGQFQGVCVDAAFLSTAKSGMVDAQGYGFLTPLDGAMSIVVQSSATQNTVLQIDGVVTQADTNYSLYTAGTIDAPSLVLCNDDAPIQDHVAQCQALP